MVKYYLLAFVLFSGSSKYVFAQYPTKTYEFQTIRDTDIDFELLRDKIVKNREKLDSIYQVNKMDSLELLYTYLNTNTTNYSAVTLSSEYISTHYNDLAIELQNNGFDALSDGIATISYGFTFKRKRCLHEYLINIGFANKSILNNVYVKVSGLNILNYTFGFDILNLKRFQFYPLIGISQQFTDIAFINKPTNTQYISLFEIGNQTNDISLQKNSWKVVGGVELDYHIKYSERSNGIIVALRYGLTNTINEGKYKLNKVKVDYEPHVALRDSYLSLVIKFYTRTQNK